MNKPLMRDHPNFKYLLNNRKCLDLDLPFTVKDERGYLYGGLEKGWVPLKPAGYIHSFRGYPTGDSYYPFYIANKYGGYVVIETTAGDIKVSEKDFQ